MDLQEKLLANSEDRCVNDRAHGPCRVWTAGHTTKGYGTLRWGGKPVLAHRMSYILAKGPIPAGLQLDHLCRVRGCINPDHLEAVTNKENQMRGIGFSARNAAKTHCANGHEFTVENTNNYIWKKNGQKMRTCRTCANARAALQRKQIKERKELWK